MRFRAQSCQPGKRYFSIAVKWGKIIFEPIAFCCCCTSIGHWEKNNQCSHIANPVVIIHSLGMQAFLEAGHQTDAIKET